MNEEKKDDDEKVKLPGGLPGTATFVYAGSGGNLTVELYDHSGHAKNTFGHDVAFLLHVAAEHKTRMLMLLRNGVGDSGSGDGGDSELFALLRDRCQDYYDVLRWLDLNEIPYHKEFDGWA